VSEPYYQDELVTLYHGDCREINLPRPDEVAMVLTDPPYGVSERTDRKSKGRGSMTASFDFPPVHGDDEPFDPTWLLAYPRVVLFGANYYADRLPISSSWIVWDKLDGLSTKKRDIGFDDNADCELAWTNLGGPARLVRLRWKGMLKGDDRDSGRVHPTQKPTGLMSQIINAWTKPGDLILDPYMGSGPVGVAAKQLGRRAIGIEIDESYCEIAAKRLAQGVLFGDTEGST
jgi:site-specific DNA-methyltransferase (adenine-specific)